MSKTVLNEDPAVVHARHVLTPWVAQGNRQPPTIVRGEGCYLYDDRGKRYLDFVRPGSSRSISATGTPASRRRSANRRARLGYAAPSFGDEKRARLAQAIAEHRSVERRRPRLLHDRRRRSQRRRRSSSRARITGRHKVLTAYRSFHGSAPGAGTLTGENRRWPNEPGIPGVVRFFAPFPYRSPFFTRDAAEECERALAHLEEIVTYEGGDRIAALLIEPVVGSNGVIVYPDGYLARLRELCDRHGILLIFDEVMTGFGRTGAAFASERFGVVPDMFTFAKGVTSAYVPLGGVAVRESLASHFDAHAASERPHVQRPSARRWRPALQRSTPIATNASSNARATMEQPLRVAPRRTAAPAPHDRRGARRRRVLRIGTRARPRESREPLVAWQGKESLNAFFADALARGLYVFGRYNAVVIAPPLDRRRRRTRRSGRTARRVANEVGGSDDDGALAGSRPRNARGDRNGAGERRRRDRSRRASAREALSKRGRAFRSSSARG